MRSMTRAAFALILLVIGAASWGQQALQQSGTGKKIVFLLVQSSNHLTPLVGATATVTISKNGAPFVAPAGKVTEISNGWYVLTPTSEDVGTLGPLLLHAEAADADPTDKEYRVVAYNPEVTPEIKLKDIGVTFIRDSDAQEPAVVKGIIAPMNVALPARLTRWWDFPTGSIGWLLLLEQLKAPNGHPKYPFGTWLQNLDENGWEGTIFDPGYASGLDSGYIVLHPEFNWITADVKGRR